MSIDGADWRYFDSGGDGPVHLLLHGGLGDGESYFPLFEPLADSGRVLAPSIPADVQTAASAVRGVAALLDRIVAGPAHVFGHSQGGYLAQVLAAVAPERVAGLTLSATCLPSERRAATIEGQLRLLRRAPDIVIRAAAAAQLRRIARIDLVSLALDDRKFWMDYLAAGLRAPNLRSRAEASAKLQLDFHRTTTINAGFRPGERYRKLILTYELDPIMRPDEGSALIAHYPGAAHYEFRGQGHLGPFVHPGPVVDHLIRMASLSFRDPAS